MNNIRQPTSNVIKFPVKNDYVVVGVSFSYYHINSSKDEMILKSFVKTIVGEPKMICNYYNKSTSETKKFIDEFVSDMKEAIEEGEEEDDIDDIYLLGLPFITRTELVEKSEKIIFLLWKYMHDLNDSCIYLTINNKRVLKVKKHQHQECCFKVNGFGKRVTYYLPKVSGEFKDVIRLPSRRKYYQYLGI